MNLSGVTSLIARLPAVARAASRVVDARPGKAVTVRTLEAAKAPLLAALADSGARATPLVVITATHNRARELSDLLRAFADDPDQVALIPEPGAGFYEPAYSDTTQVQARVSALWQVLAGRPSVVIVPARALMQRVSPGDVIGRAVQTLRSGSTIRPLDLAEHWSHVGYTSAPVVEEPGFFTRRGGILDVFPVGLSSPIRLEFFGDEIESIRTFDPLTQRSAGELAEVTVLPAADLLADDARLDELDVVDTSTLAEASRQRWERSLDRLRASERFDGIDLFAGYLPAVSVLDLLPSDSVLVLDEPVAVSATLQALSAQCAEARLHGIETRELPAALAEPHLDAGSVESQMRSRRQLHLTWGSLPGGDGIDLEADVTPLEVFAGRTNAALERAISDADGGAAVIIVTQQSKRLSEMLADQNVTASIASEVRTVAARSLTLVQGTIPEGFEIEVDGVSLRLVTDSELFGVAKATRSTRPRPARHAVVISDLEPGCYVVHIEHGVGRYRGLVKMTSDGVDRDYLMIEYADQDRLYVPVDQADRVDRYIGPGDSTPAMHRLGTTDWNRAKARVRAAVQEMAEELLQLYAARETVEGHAFTPDGQWQVDLESSFPFLETPDQVEALAEIKADMELSKPMDRLLCGDVGYGKTELALRAAFKAVNDGKQVAVLVPTTVLAQQHDRTFRERLRPFPVKVEMLSRFRSQREQDSVVAGLAAGSVDICVGTHRLIQKDVQFRDLGLVIIDEEQRFGVAHKERLKQLRQEVDVLTLTATPIPRTLQMALTGVRDMSVMETPPEDRLPIKTYVHEYDEHIVREAMLREIDRGGQVYFVHNRVQTIYGVAARLRELVPEARISIGHGQLPEDALEQVMLGFAAGESDVLVCSTIIESGLDISNVNTIIVNRADTFGLAQLYQLRGRVGRGANRAFAYFLYPKGRQLSEIAEKRLRTIFEASDLGAGLKIAMKDLEIRGAGNLLGSEQHGHVAAVGFHLYTQLLSEAVHRLRGRAPTRRLTASVDIPIRAFIPDEYISDEGLRLNVYQRLAAATDADRLGHIALELKDRFGPPPVPVLSLLFVAQVRCSASAALVESVSMEGKEVILRRPMGVVFRRDEFLPAFAQWLRVGTNQVGIRADDGPLRWQERLSAVLDHLAGPQREAPVQPARVDRTEPALKSEPKVKALRRTTPRPKRARSV